MAQKVTPIHVKEKIRDLLEQGEMTPFYFIDLDAIREKAINFKNTARAAFGTAEIAYSIKTNNLRAISQTLALLGWSAEGVSGTEIKSAEADGFPHTRLIFNGPIKQSAEIDYCLSHGVRINVDSLHELAEIVTRAQALEISNPRVGFRLSHRAKGKESRFGLSTHEAEQGKKILEQNRITLAGVHIHAGSNMLDPSSVKFTITEFSKFIRNSLGAGAWIDLGGGFPADSASPNKPSPQIADYLQDIAVHLRAEMGEAIDQYLIILEPGRSMVEDEGYLVTKVHHHKTRENRTLFFCDAGLNQLISMHSWAHSIESVYDKPLTLRKTLTLTGANCFESDYLCTGVPVDYDINAGDFLLIRGCGGYDIPSATAWTRPSIPVFGILDDTTEVLRHATPESLFRRNDASIVDRWPKNIAVEQSVHLRAISKKDAHNIHATVLNNQSHLTQWLHWPRYVNSFSDTLSFTRHCEAGFDARTEATYGIWLNENFIGVVGFNEFDHTNKIGYIGYWLAREVQGAGHATAAVAALVEAFDSMGTINRSVIKCSTLNNRSRAVAERLGFKQEGKLVAAERIGDLFYDQYIYSRVNCHSSNEN